MPPKLPPRDSFATGPRPPINRISNTSMPPPEPAAAPRKKVIDRFSSMFKGSPIPKSVASYYYSQQKSSSSLPQPTTSSLGSSSLSRPPAPTTLQNGTSSHHAPSHAPTPKKHTLPTEDNVVPAPKRRATMGEFTSALRAPERKVREEIQIDSDEEVELSPQRDDRKPGSRTQGNGFFGGIGKGLGRVVNSWGTPEKRKGQESPSVWREQEEDEEEEEQMEEGDVDVVMESPRAGGRTTEVVNGSGRRSAHGIREQAPEASSSLGRKRGARQDYSKVQSSTDTLVPSSPPRKIPTPPSRTRLQANIPDFSSDPAEVQPPAPSKEELERQRRVEAANARREKAKKEKAAKERAAEEARAKAAAAKEKAAQEKEKAAQEKKKAAEDSKRKYAEEEAKRKSAEEAEANAAKQKALEDAKAANVPAITPSANRDPLIAKPKMKPSRKLTKTTIVISSDTTTPTPSTTTPAPPTGPARKTRHSLGSTAVDQVVPETPAPPPPPPAKSGSSSTGRKLKTYGRKEKEIPETPYEPAPTRSPPRALLPEDTSELRGAARAQAKQKQTPKSKVKAKAVKPVEEPTPRVTPKRVSRLSQQYPPPSSPYSLPSSPTSSRAASVAPVEEPTPPSPPPKEPSTTKTIRKSKSTSALKPTTNTKKPSPKTVIPPTPENTFQPPTKPASTKSKAPSKPKPAPARSKSLSRLPPNTFTPDTGSRRSSGRVSKPPAEFWKADAKEGRRESGFKIAWNADPEKIVKGNLRKGGKVGKEDEVKEVKRGRTKMAVDRRLDYEFSDEE